jgi:type IV secretory pathway VirD2 relaxase
VAATDKEDEFRLRPRKPRGVGSDGTAKAFRLLTRLARKQAGKLRRGGAGARAAYRQRCSVRAMYSENATPGQWAAHGRYISRESASGEREAAGFSADRDGVDIPSKLGEWQNAGDQRMWKFIISPEFGDRVDMERLTRDLMSQMERDLGIRLQWVAVTHSNTDHRHTHVALRGIDANGKEFRLDPEYVSNGLRTVAEDLCTRQLGYRTREDAELAMRREIGQARFTGLDRAIKRELQPGGIYQAAGSGFRGQCIGERLCVLEGMGLARNDGGGQWTIRENFEQALRAAQKAADRQKTLTAHGVAGSDERLPFSVLSMRKLHAVEGRILVHGEDDAGWTYSMLESTDGRLLMIRHTPELQAARSQMKMRPDHFVRIEKQFADGKPTLGIEDFGKSEDVLKNKQHLAARAKAMRSPAGQWGGWLGRYCAALEHERSDAQRRQPRER